MAQISVARALTLLNTLNDRIDDAISQGQFIGMAIGDKVVAGFKDNNEFSQSLQSSLQSVEALIKRRNAVKSAIVASNAVTQVVIAGEEMTVAGAIERKTSIAYDQALLAKLKEQYHRVLHDYERKQQEVANKVEELLKVTYGKDRKVTDSEYDSTAKPFKAQYDPVLINPLDLKKVIQDMSQKISDFLVDVDAVLTESNVATKIEIPD